MSEHGTLRRYRSGCSCLECTAAATLDKQKERLRTRTRQAPATAIKPKGAGAVELGVLEDVSRLNNPSKALVAASLALARILDNPGAITSQPAAARQLDSLLERLRRGAEAPQAKLVGIRQMTKRVG